MGDEENRMPKNARREKNSKKESERERERKKRETERERERAARERTAIQYGETRRTVALYQKVPATYIYIYSLEVVYPIIYRVSTCFDHPEMVVQVSTIA